MKWNDECVNCNSEKQVDMYAFVDWKVNKEFFNQDCYAPLCLDCWIIVYKEGEYVPH